MLETYLAELISRINLFMTYWVGPHWPAFVVPFVGFVLIPVMLLNGKAVHDKRLRRRVKTPKPPMYFYEEESQK